MHKIITKNFKENPDKNLANKEYKLETTNKYFNEGTKFLMLVVITYIVIPIAASVLVYKPIVTKLNEYITDKSLSAWASLGCTFIIAFIFAMLITKLFKFDFFLED